MTKAHRSQSSTRITGGRTYNAMPRIAAIVAGTGFYDVEAIRSRCAPGTRLLLKRDPSNRFDPFAIGVHLPSLLFGSTQLGHLKAPLAKGLAPKMDAGVAVHAIVSSTFAPGDREHPRLSISIEYDE